jgi:class 3 adenylate cyclase
MHVLIQEQLAMGDTPNIAARLQILAVPNTVVLSTVTGRLLHAVFALEDVRVQQLKGVTEPADDEVEPAPARTPSW